MTTDRYKAWIYDLNTCEYGHNLLTEVEDLKKEVKRLKKAAMDTENEVQQILGRALNYPWFKDDQKNFPGTTKSDGVCVGEHVAATLAMEATDTINTLMEYLQEFLDTEDKECCFDHHGFCQNHGSNQPCIVAEAREFMATLEKK